MQDPTTRPDITRPADLASASLRELLDAWHRHAARLVDARHGLGDPLPAARLARHGLDALAVGQGAHRPADGHAVGHHRRDPHLRPTLERTAAAMGLEVEELAVGLRMWADGQHQHAGMSAAARDEVYALLGEVAR